MSPDRDADYILGTGPAERTTANTAYLGQLVFGAWARRPA